MSLNPNKNIPFLKEDKYRRTLIFSKTCLNVPYTFQLFFIIHLNAFVKLVNFYWGKNPHLGLFSHAILARYETPIG